MPKLVQTILDNDSIPQNDINVNNQYMQNGGNNSQSSVGSSTEFMRVLNPRSGKSRDYQARESLRFVTDISNALGIPRGVGRQEILPVVKEIADTLRTDGRITSSQADSLFERAYDAGRVVLDDFYNQYKPVRD